MYPIFKKFHIPYPLSDYLPNPLIIYTYGLCIFLGIVLSFIFFYKKSKDFGLKTEDVGLIFLVAIAAAFLGGKFLYFLEAPFYHSVNFDLFLKNWQVGFVFFGSFIFVVISLYYLFRYYKLPVFVAFDWLAICGMIIHGIGKIGCFAAGCCYGKPCSNFFAVTYTHPLAVARPLGQSLYPVQLIDAFFVLTLLIVSLIFFRKKPFDGFWMIMYTMCYAVLRFFTELIRGDESRGYIIKNYLTHSQFISVVLVVICLFLLRYKYKKK